MNITVIGGGLAGVEAAWIAANMGVPVNLIEMRPQKMTPAHRTGDLCELVCSNSLGSNVLPGASALLKSELKSLGSLIIECAEMHQVPAGRALAVDREAFSREITERVASHPLINLSRRELNSIPTSRPLIIATGPLTSGDFAQSIDLLLGEGSLYFFDAVSPVVIADSVDMSRAFWASRYSSGVGDYLNCNLTEEEYGNFWKELVSGRVVEKRTFESNKLFEACLPIEEMARRGRDTIRFGPLKPVGLFLPGSGDRPYAVVQLRKEDSEGRLLGLVGFQTRLTFPEQKRVFRLIPALKDCRFARLGVMHRNSFIRSPAHLDQFLVLKGAPGIFFAGQITGVEGYLSSAATGLAAGFFAARNLLGKSLVPFPPQTCLGGLITYVSSSPSKNFQPMGINFGLLPPVPGVRPKKARREAAVKRALKAMAEFIAEND
ncbi:MAG: methylenetetrahydrofolate--tRNA-(uracil(54)-C(5))-methyltransferase (FADH(2)-oxidizing) TrmFO [bacterium]|jgi:methylenetetrahydrofolate--tRNA-(uracil-5-)-methyltransferase|nr:methylenetetrahydrofolate--tRNA-(uracil(54)-C(5))-methyltransferase (FADH(2)-oxidizing) TrmFO [bacterium]